MPKVKKRGKSKDINRRTKKKISILNTEKIEYVDWKDANLLRRFLSERAKIRARRVTGNNTQQQKLVADAIKLAREMALVPYANRVTTQGRGNRGDRDRDRGGRAEGPVPRPSAPPPSRDDEDLSEASAADTGPAETVELEGVTIDGKVAMVTDAVDPAVEESES